MQSDEAKMEVLSVNATHHVDSLYWGSTGVVTLCFSANVTALLMHIEERMNLMHDQIFDKHLPSVRVLKMKHGWIFLHDNDCTGLDKLRIKYFKVLEWHSKYPDIGRITSIE